ncbi:MAG TPA: gamma-glutamyltransferase, partial [Turneriella sp.]|nr:gamma-glutamyltransferase [Turneriella sp.]
PVAASTMTDSDLKNYRVAERPVAVRCIGKNIFYSMSAPASGAYTLAAVTNAPQSASEDSFFKASLAAQQQSFIQREKTLEDPDWNWVKKNQSVPEKSSAHESENTTHVSIVDVEGNIVSYTASVEMSMGSALFVQGRGFILNNELTDFTPIPKRVNAVEQGKRGRVTALNAEARETVGGKRPNSSMSPLIFEREDGTFFALGSPGGPTIVGVNALVAARLLRREELAAAVLAPRAIAMPSGHIIAELVIKQNRELVEALHRSGFPIDTTRKIISLGSVQAVSFNPKTNTYRAVSDLRREGLALVAKPKVD